MPTPSDGVPREPVDPGHDRPAPVATPPGPAARPNRATGTGRTVASALLLLAGWALVVVGIFGWWADRTVLDSGYVAGAVYDSLDDPVLVEGLAEFVDEELLGPGDVVDTIVILQRQTIDPELSIGDDPAIDEAIDAFNADVVDQIEELVTDEPVRGEIAERVADTHAVVVALLRDDAPPVTRTARVESSDGVQRVVVDFLVIVERGLVALDDLAASAGVTLPDPERAGTTDERIADLEAALGAELHDGFGVVSVYDRVPDAPTRRERLANLAIGVADARWWFLGVGTLATAVAIVLAPRRGTPLLVFGALLLPAALGTWLVGRAGIRRAADSAYRDTVREILRDAGDQLTSSLTRTCVLVAAVGVAFVVGGLTLNARDRRRVEAAAWSPSTHHR